MAANQSFIEQKQELASAAELRLITRADNAGQRDLSCTPEVSVLEGFADIVAARQRGAYGSRLTSTSQRRELVRAGRAHSRRRA